MDNFLLKIHMEEDTLKEIYLNKERRSFIFDDDDCVSDLIIPEFRINSINMILENQSGESGDDTYYAEYEKNGKVIREYDKDKIEILIEMLTKISINDFIEYIDNIKVNDFYVDNIIDVYECVLPLKMKKILSYTSNGVAFNDDLNYYLLSHAEIKESGKEYRRKKLIPLIKFEDKMLCYDYLYSRYVTLVDDKIIKEAVELQNLISYFDDEEKKSDNTSINLQEMSSKIEEALKTKDSKEQEKETENVHVNMDATIKNIDLQFERLNTNVSLENQAEIIPIVTEKVVEPTIEVVTSAEPIKPTKSISAEERAVKDDIKKQIQSLLDNKDIMSLKTQTANHEKNQKEEKDEELLQSQKNAIFNQFISSSLQHSCANYRINFNDTQKLVVEHLPYYELPNSFSVIQIPEIEFDKMTLLPKSEIDFGKIKFKVAELDSKHVDLLVTMAENILDKEGNKLKKGSHLILDLKSEITLRIDKKNAMETWTIRMEQSTFEKELRNIDFGKILNLIEKLPLYKTLGNIEKYELKKSLMLFINFVMQNHDEKKLQELYKILNDNKELYEEFITKYNIENALKDKNSLPTYEDKKEFVEKLNYVKGLIEAKWLDYPRFIFNSHSFFEDDYFLQEFISGLDESLQENDFSDYLLKTFKQYKVFNSLDEVGRDNLQKCLEYLSVLYQKNPFIGESNKYRLEKNFMIGFEEEDIALLISKLCRKGIKDYSVFVEYDAMMKEKYRIGELQYPIYSDSFGIEEIRNGGEIDEY